MTPKMIHLRNLYYIQIYSVAKSIAPIPKSGNRKPDFPGQKTEKVFNGTKEKLKILTTSGRVL